MTFVEKHGDYTVYSFRIRRDLKDKLLDLLKRHKINRTKTFEKIVLSVIEELEQLPDTKDTE